jgi:hypothetical protein
MPNDDRGVSPFLPQLSADWVKGILAPWAGDSIAQAVLNVVVRIRLE